MSEDLAAASALPPTGELPESLHVPAAPPPAADAPRTVRGIRLGGRSLREHAARGTLINTAFQIALNFLAFARGFILAGFLSRSDYGVWGVLVVSLGTLAWLKTAGVGDKYIQQDEPDQEAAFQKAFTLELIFTGGLVVVMLAALPIMAVIYGEPKLVLPGLVAIAALPAVVLQAPLWVYYRNMDFLRQRLLQAVDPLVATAVSITLAASGAGYWAFVLGLVAGAYSAGIAALLASPYRIRLRYERGTAGTYVQFAWPLIAAGAGSMVIAQSGVIATEAHLGLAGAGALTLASSITRFTNEVDRLVSGSLYPAICAVRDRTELLYESFVKSNRLALIWAVPFGFALTLFVGDLVSFGIGEKWRPAVVVVQVYGATAAIAHIGFNWDAYFRARGQTRPMAVASWAAAVTFVAVAIPLLIRYDLPGFAAGVAAQAAVHLAVRAWYLKRLFVTFAFARHASRAMLPAAIAAATVLLVRVAAPADRTAALALAEAALYVLVTAAATWAIERALLREAVGYVRAARTAGAPA